MSQITFRKFQKMLLLQLLRGFFLLQISRVDLRTRWTCTRERFALSEQFDWKRYLEHNVTCHLIFNE